MHQLPEVNPKDRPTDRALWALGRTYYGCGINRPCEAHREDRRDDQE